MENIETIDQREPKEIQKKENIRIELKAGDLKVKRIDGKYYMLRSGYPKQLLSHIYRTYRGDIHTPPVCPTDLQYWKVDLSLSILNYFCGEIGLLMKSRRYKGFYEYDKNQSVGSSACFLLPAFVHKYGLNLIAFNFEISTSMVTDWLVTEKKATINDSGSFLVTMMVPGDKLPNRLYF